MLQEGLFYFSVRSGDWTHRIWMGSSRPV